MYNDARYYFSSYSMSTQPYHQLIVWKEAHRFVLMVYKQTELFPKSELYTLVSQLRRAAVSIPANIVEGQMKQSKKDFLRYLNIAEGSSKECAYFLELARDLLYLTSENFLQLESQRAKTDLLLHRFKNGLRNQSQNSTPNIS